MTRKRLRTGRGYDFYEVASAMQKGIRRNDPKIAGYFALELFESGYHKYVWKRLLTVSAEDCAGVITHEIKSLHQSFQFVNERTKKDVVKGRIFISKAVLILCEAMKSRESDHLQNLVYDRKLGITDEEIDKWITEVRADENVEIPDYAYDCHTMEGKHRGKTKKDFFIDEHNALNPKQGDMFEDLIDKM
jgi:replication-associated recombination protein RarA